MKLPVAVRVSGIPYEFLTETENVSACGVFFYIDRWMNQGTHLELTVHFSSLITLSGPLEVRLQARVVRVVPQARTTHSGVAAFIEAFQLLPAGGGSIDSGRRAPGPCSRTSIAGR
jgi:PilZ domain